MSRSERGTPGASGRDQTRAAGYEADVGSRRRFLASAGGVIMAMASDALVPSTVRAQSQSGTANPMFAYVGCYTTEKRNGRGRGINVYRMDPTSGDWTHVQLVPDVVNPSFLALDRGKRFLYSVHGDMSYASAFAIDEATGQLRFLNRHGTKGKNPVHLAVDRSNRFLVVSNYSSGSVCVLEIHPDGLLGGRSDLVQLQGEPGPDPTEQTGSHPHHNPFDPSGRFLVVPDKGLDKLFVFSLEARTGKLAPAHPPHVDTRPGAGPRHVDFHPRLPCAYVINELDSTLTTYRFAPERGELTPRQVDSALPSGFTGTNVTAEIAVAPSGKYVYASNRGHDSIAIFAIDQTSGLPRSAGWASAQGRTPRFFCLDPSARLLYVCNQDSDTIVTFRVDRATGELTPTGQVVSTGSPVTIVFR